jgi:hypothetical protein
MTCYATVAQARNQMDTNLTTADDELFRAVRRVSERVDQLYASALPVFAPYKKALTFPFKGYLYNYAQRLVRVPLPLLELTTVEIKTDPSASYATVSAEAWPDTETPIRELYLSNWNNYYNGGLGTLRITGLWGRHIDYENAWDSVDALTALLSSSAVELEVEDLDGADSYGATPRISPGNLIRVPDADGVYEYMEVISTEATESTSAADVVGVRRAVNGTTAAEHASTATVEVYRPPVALTEEVARQAALWVSRRGAFESVTVGDFNTTTYPADLLHGLLAVCEGLGYAIR